MYIEQNMFDFYNNKQTIQVDPSVPSEVVESKYCLF